MADTSMVVHWTRYLTKDETDRLNLIANEAPAIGVVAGPSLSDHLTLIIADADWFDMFVAATPEAKSNMKVPSEMIALTYWGWPEDPQFGGDFPSGWNGV